MTSECPLTDEIVSYIYGEIEGRAGYDFEKHLAECTVCIDEFAAVCDPRFSVFEWKKEAFDPLPTPAFEVPYERLPAASELGFMAAIKVWARGLSIPVAVAAALALFVGVGIIMFAMRENGESFAVNNARPVEPDTRPVPRAPAVVAPLAPPRSDRSESEGLSGSAVQPAPVSTLPRKRTERSRAVVAEKKPSNNIDNVPQTRKAPALTAYQENDDESLRLAELFDEVGG